MGKLRPIQEVAQDHGVSVRHLYRLISQGKLERYRRSGDRRTYVDEDKVREALGFHRVE
jgi:excisionase family DNA binding protein